MYSKAFLGLIRFCVEPLTQIVGGVGLLLAGVLNLLGNLLSGLGLDSLLKGIVAATVRAISTLNECGYSHSFVGPGQDLQGIGTWKMAKHFLILFYQRTWTWTLLCTLRTISLCVPKK